MLGTDRRNLKEQQSCERKRRAQALRNKYKDLCHLSSSRITKAESKDNIKKMLDSVFGNQKENLATTDRRYLISNHDFRDSFSSNPATPQASSLANHIANNPDQVTQQQQQQKERNFINSHKTVQKVPTNESQTGTGKNSLFGHETRPVPHCGVSQTIPVKDPDCQNKCGEQKTTNSLLDCSQHEFLDRSFDFTSVHTVVAKLDKLLKEISIPPLLTRINDVALNEKAPDALATASQQFLQKDNELPKASVGKVSVKEVEEQSFDRATTLGQSNSLGAGTRKSQRNNNSKQERNWLESIGKQMSPTAPLKVKRSQLSTSVSLEEGEIREEGSKKSAGQIQKRNKTKNDVDEEYEAAFQLANSEKFYTTLGIPKETADCFTLEEKMRKAKVLVNVFGGQISDIDDEDEEDDDKDDNIDGEIKTETCPEETGDKNSIDLEDGEIQEGGHNSSYSLSDSSASPSDSSDSEPPTSPVCKDLSESLADNNEQSQRNWSLSCIVEDMKKEFVNNPTKPSPARSAFTPRGRSSGQPVFKPAATQPPALPIKVEKASPLPLEKKSSQRDSSTRPVSRNEINNASSEESKAFKEGNSEKQFESSNVLLSKSKPIGHSKSSSKDSLEAKENKVKSVALTGGATTKQIDESRKKLDIKATENAVKLPDESKKGEGKKSGKKSVEAKIPEAVEGLSGSSFASAMNSLPTKSGSKRRSSQQIGKNPNPKEVVVPEKKESLIKMEAKEDAKKKRKLEELNESNDKTESERNVKKCKTEVQGIILKFDKEKIARLEKLEQSLKRKLEEDEESSTVEAKKAKISRVETPVKSKLGSRADKELKRKSNESTETQGDVEKLKKKNKKVTNNDIDKKSTISGSSKSDVSKSSLDADSAMKEKIHNDLFQKNHKVSDNKPAASKTKSISNSIKKVDASLDDSLSGFPKPSNDVKSKPANNNNSVRKVDASLDDSLSGFPKLSTDVKAKPTNNNNNNNAVKKVDNQSDDSLSGFPKLSTAVKMKSSNNSVKKVDPPPSDDSSSVGFTKTSTVAKTKSNGGSSAKKVNASSKDSSSSSLKPSTDVPNNSFLGTSTSTIVDNSASQKDGRQRPAGETQKKSDQDKKAKSSDTPQQQATLNKSKTHRTPRNELSSDRTEPATVQSKSKKNAEDTTTPGGSRDGSSKSSHLNALCERLANPEVVKNRSESLCSDSISSVIVVHLMVNADLLARYVREAETRPEAFDIKGLKKTISSLEFLTKEVTDEVDKEKLHYMLWSLEAMVYYHYHKLLKSQKDVNYLNATIERLQEQIMGHNSPKASPDSSSASCLKEFQNLLKSGAVSEGRSGKVVDKTKPDKTSSDDLTYIFSFSHIAVELAEKLSELETRPSCCSVWKQFGKFNISMNIQEWIKWLNSISQPFRSTGTDSLPLL